MDDKIDWRTAEAARREAQARGLYLLRVLEARYAETGPLLGARDGWEIRARNDGRPPWRGWRKFVVVSTRRSTRKSKFLGAWNGKYLARTHDMAILLERHPEVHAWVATTVPATMKEANDV
jgi:hypothetical protein